MSRWNGRRFSGVSGAPLASLEKRYLAWAAEHFPGDRKALAERLGISERTLYRKLGNTEADPP